METVNFIFDYRREYYYRDYNADDDNNNINDNEKLC